MRKGDEIVNSTETLTYDVFVSDPPPHNDGLLPNGEPKGGSPVASTLIYGSEDAVLTDPRSRRIRRMRSVTGSPELAGT